MSGTGKSKTVEDLVAGRTGTVITTDKDGNPQFKGTGFTFEDGAACKNIQDLIIETTGGKITDRELLPEYNEEEGERELA